MKEILQKILDAIPNHVAFNNIVTKNAKHPTGLCYIATQELEECDVIRFCEYVQNLFNCSTTDYVWSRGLIRPRVEWLQKEIKRLS